MCQMLCEVTDHYEMPEANQDIQTLQAVEVSEQQKAPLRADVLGKQPRRLHR